MFNVGDIITGTPENDYGITTRGMICRVIGVDRYDPGRINVEIIDADEDLIKESKSSFARHLADPTTYIGCEYDVSEKYFEYYESKANFEDLLDKLVDFVNSI